MKGMQWHAGHSSWYRKKETVHSLEKDC